MFFSPQNYLQARLRAFQNFAELIGCPLRVASVVAQEALSAEHSA